jgi:hypothetical protein
MSMIGNYRRVSERTLNDLLANPQKISEYLYSEDGVSSDESLDIDKSWHIIHFLLTGDAWESDPPWGDAVLGGTPISEEDMGYGPARYLTPMQVRAVSQALATVSPEQLIARWDERRVADAELYPQIWDDSLENREYVSIYYDELRSLFATAAKNSEAMIVWLN